MTTRVRTWIGPWATTLTVVVALLVAAGCAGPRADDAGAGAGAGGAGATETLEVEGLAFEVPAEWERQEPSSFMRVHQRRVGSGDAAATFIVWRFDGMIDPGDGSMIEENVRRWQGMMDGPDGGPPDTTVEDVEVAGMEGRLVELAGTWVAPAFPGSDQRAHEPNWRMLGAYIQADDGSIVLRLVGPDVTVAHHREAFRRAVLGLRPADGR